MTLKEILLQEIESSDDELLLEIIQWIRAHKKTSKQSVSPAKMTIVEFFQQSPLAEALASGELDLTRDQAIYPDRFVL